MKLKKQVSFSLLLAFTCLILSCNNQITAEDKGDNTIISRSINADEAFDIICRYFDDSDSYLKEVTFNGKTYSYIEMQAKGKNNPIPAHYTTSEATAYGMRLAIYGFKSIKGHSMGAAYGRAHFKRIYNDLWQTQSQFKSTEDSRLHSWIIPKSLDKKDCSSSKTEAELDLAYALLQAHKLWGSTDYINYKFEAQKIIDGIAQSLTNTVNVYGRNITYLKVGDWMENNNLNAFYSRPSDWMLHHLKTFILFYVEEGGIGTNTFNTLNDLLMDAEYLFNLNPFGNGFFPDFVYFNPQQNRIETVKPGSQFDKNMDEDVLIDKYSWNACKIPWRLAMDVVLNQEHFDIKASRKILRDIYRKVYLGNNSNSNAIGSGYNLNGDEIEPYYSPAFAAPIVTGIYNVEENSFGAAKYVHDIRKKELPILLSKYSGNSEWGYYADTILCFTTLLLERDKEVLASPY